MAVVRGTPPGGCGILLTCDSLTVVEDVETVGGPPDKAPAKAPLCLKIHHFSAFHTLQEKS